MKTSQTESKSFEENRIIRIGTRGSALALIQADMVIERLQQEYPDYVYEKVILQTKGDRQTERALLEFGGKAVFVEEFEDAIQCGDIDLAVHSAKDMPVELKEGLTIAGVLPRADVRDVLIYRKNSTFAQRMEQLSNKCTKESIFGKGEASESERKGKADCPEYGKFRIGTSSLRRQCQIQNLLPGITCVPLRGNVNTRIDKLRKEEYDAIILAAAGVKRMKLNEERDLNYHYFSCEEMLPAACQAIIAIETKKNGRAYDMGAAISDSSAFLQFLTERRILKLLNAGCHEAVGVYAQLDGEKMLLTLMQEKEGSIYRNMVEGPCDAWETLAESVI